MRKDDRPMSPCSFVALCVIWPGLHMQKALPYRDCTLTAPRLKALLCAWTWKWSAGKDQRATQKGNRAVHLPWTRRNQHHSSSSHIKQHRLNENVNVILLLTHQK